MRPAAYLVLEGNEYRAIPVGKSAPILRPVPGNTRPASAARWLSVREAAGELASMGFVLDGDHAHWCEHCTKQWRCPNGADCESESRDGCCTSACYAAACGGRS